MTAKEFAQKCAISAGEALTLCPKQSKCGPAYKLLVGTNSKDEAPFGCENCIRSKWTEQAELVDLRFRVVELLGWQFGREDVKINLAQDNDIWRERVTLAAEYQRRAVAVFKCEDIRKLENEFLNLRKGLANRIKKIGEGNTNAD